MKGILQRIAAQSLLLLATTLAAVSCDVGDYGELCDYNLQLRYDYNEENTSQQNMIEYYVYGIDEYIFDEEGILFRHNRITPDVCREYLNSELTLPPGRYSVIAIGNRDERSGVWDNLTGNAPVEGQTRREDLRMALDNAEQLDGGTKGPSEKLYHGYRTFTVKPQGISRVRVNVINAHCFIRFRVTWRNNTTPPRGVDYHATLDGIASHYKLMPEYIYPRNTFDYALHDPAIHDDYAPDDNGVIHHIPFTHFEDRNVLSYRNDTRINADNELWGEFITYRFKTEDSPVLSIVRSSDDHLIVPKVIDLRVYFDWYYSNESDYTLKQDYYINIDIDGNLITMMPLNVADWEEGGILH